MTTPTTILLSTFCSAKWSAGGTHLERYAMAASLQPPVLSGSYRAAVSVSSAGWGAAYIPASRRAEVN